MQPAGGRADLLGDRRRERNHVVLSGLLDLVDAGDVERRLLPQFARVRGRDNTGVDQRVGRRQLDLEPGLVAPLLAPDRAHLRVGVSRNHPIQTFNRSAEIVSPPEGPTTVAPRRSSWNRSRGDPLDIVSS